MRTAAAAAVVAGGTACNSGRSPWRFLRVHEARTLAAMCDCIIPPDGDPGAQWAQVVNYIDLQLCGHFSKKRDAYREGIADLEVMCQKRFGKAFAELGQAEQTAVLKELESGTAPKDIWTTVRAKDFFEMVLAHAMQGYYGDPRHGGNRDRVGWKMLGLSYPQVRGRFRGEVGKDRVG